MNQTVVLNLNVESLHEQNELEKGYKEYILKGSIQDFDAVHYFEVPVEGRDEDEKTEYFRKFTDFIKRKGRKVEVEVQVDIIQGDEEGTYLFDISQNIDEPNKILEIKGFKGAAESDETKEPGSADSPVESHSNGDEEGHDESEADEESVTVPEKTEDGEQNEVKQDDAAQHAEAVQQETSINEITDGRLQHIYDAIKSPIIQGDEAFKRAIRIFSRDFLTNQLGEYPKPLIGLFTVVTHMSKKNGLDYKTFKENYINMINVNPETGQLKLFDVLNDIPATEYMKDLYTTALATFREDASVEKSLEEYLEEIALRMKEKEGVHHG